ncbi:hypothetical protein SLS63_005191 [Diaporthe eres]|uniref:Hsp70 family chaperone n=1 Tax=Diaporthe eres TaxID=83184 RepID=A0ABR1PBS3_DIAER
MSGRKKKALGASEPLINMEVNDDVERELQVKPLVIGLDIGTTFSGAAWQQFSEDEIFFVLAWPSSQGENQDRIKVPSRLHYDDQGTVTTWGYDDPNGEANTLEWFKLALVPNEDLPPGLWKSTKLIETRDKMRDLKIDATQAMAQYMEKIWTHALHEIKESIGSRDFDSTPLQAVITIPAIWGNQAIDKMKTAAASSIMQSRPAGLTTYEFLSEPEAAVQAYAKKLQRKLRLHEIVLVLDLGGGTGDVICYEKVGDGEECYLELKEAIPGDGDLCGAIFADEAFEKLLLGKMPLKYKNLKANDPQRWKAILSEQWHRSIKRNFEWKGNNRIWRVVLANSDRKLDVLLHENEIRNVFERSVMPKILGLIQRQIAALKLARGGKVPSIILPVGGFGRCAYILQRLKEVFQHRSIDPPSAKRRKKTAEKPKGPEIEIHSDKGETPWGAVCKGACQFGMRAHLNNRLVKSRRSRISLGFIQSEPGDAEDEQGDLIDVDKEWTMPMYLACDVFGKGIHSERSTIYAYYGDSAPERYNGNDPKFREWAVMMITATKPIEKLPKDQSITGGKRRFDYNLNVKIVGGSVELTATSAVPGDGDKEVGKLVLPKLDTI